ncbi:hypothetical protein WJX73_009223 [Symbiochloris irregularis]|uniref:DNA helicase n=1 Tax=Symbiochloris irregularis TaxID=706552 RepID=A0AAW1PMW0_9CHLO
MAVFEDRDVKPSGVDFLPGALLELCRQELEAIVRAPEADSCYNCVQRLVTIQGTVVRCGAVNVLESHRLYECKQCLHRFVVEVELELRAAVQLPVRCPAEDCSSSAFKHVKEAQMHTEYQEISLQATAHTVEVGAPPKAVTVVMRGELADSCQAGEEIEVAGVVVQQWKPSFPGVRCDTSIVVHANNVARLGPSQGAEGMEAGDDSHFRQFWDVVRDRPLAARNQIVQAVAPGLHGAMVAKLAVLLALLGGVESSTSHDGPTSRANIHVLLAGDPATGKSQLLKRASMLAHRAVCVSGRGSTGAGLTASAVKDATGGAWALEAGALVLADAGTLCLDDIEALKIQEITALHEAMEQQSVSIAKAGIVTSLPARASIIASASCQKRRYNPQESVGANTGLTGPLLSRFDAILLMRDLPQPVWDAAAADHILSRRSSPHEDGTLDSAQKLMGGWTTAKLRCYVAWARDSFSPSTTREAESLLLWYYNWRRRTGGHSTVRATVRLLQGLLRLSQAHAKLMARQTPGASLQEIKQAYRKQCMQHHPDLCPPEKRAQAEIAFKQISEAYAKLTGRAPVHDWHANRGHNWASKAPVRFNNFTVAAMLVVPLLFGGVYLGTSRERLAEASWRPQGLMNPPVNPFLRDDQRATQRRHWIKDSTKPP